jgi:hypothetical protein
VNFNEKYEKTNYSSVIACGLAIFSNLYFIGSSVIYLSLSKIPIWTPQRQFGLNKEQGTAAAAKLCPQGQNRYSQCHKYDKPRLLVVFN